MKVLISPMSAMVETKGPFSRTAVLANEFMERGHEVALCAPEDNNYYSINKVQNYYAPVPSPLGMPVFIGRGMFKLFQSVGFQPKKKANSFEDILHFIGAIDRRYFRKDVSSIRKAIQAFKPDVMYSEFRISAIVAARLEKVKIATGFSYPVQKNFACNPEYSKGVNQYLQENGLDKVESVLEIFDWADFKIIPSSYELEPMDGEDVVFVGPLSAPRGTNATIAKNKIIAYMGNGVISPRQVINALTKAFAGSDYEVYIASEQVKPFKTNNIVVGKKFDFSKLMPEASAYINHGGQNSIMTGLMYGVPQIVCPGGVFERRYNASSVAKLNAGVFLEANDFNSETLKRIVHDFKENPAYANNAKQAGEKLLSLGGVRKAVQAMENLVLK
ncbi:UDP-glucoronosyl and UDP-glucosyl transferase [Paenibacillus oralis]|uniref:UDP-glucoronosyl and UDP-glucosyl transferase n=1 Tax=Paenibacillus oralis TaxID=2490856 RepID=A0A3P3U0Y9_9BACL|nr:UDP-glucoronosyl and UDP-glucosyl transferase [Paenibacillus oralis]